MNDWHSTPIEQIYSYFLGVNWLISGILVWFLKRLPGYILKSSLPVAASWMSLFT